MTTIVMVALWLAALSGWSTAIYLFIGAQANVPPKTKVIVRLVVVGIISLVTGCITLAAMNSIGAYHNAFKF